jgi:outer membrane protein TolC
MEMSISRSHRPLAQWCALLIAVLCAVLAGCDVGPRYLSPATTAPQVYKESPERAEETGEWSIAKPQDAALRGNWWEIYSDPELNALEDQLNIDNQNIRQAFENFMEARALVREARSQYFPTVGVGGSYTRSRTSSNIGSTSSTGAPSGKQSQVFAFPADVSWEPDLWGRVHRPIDCGRS